MLPAIRPGDIVTIRSGLPTEASTGDVVLFMREGRFFVHRVVGRGVAGLVTKGDAIPAEDPPVQPHEFLGFVISTLRGPRLLPWASRLYARLKTLALGGAR